MKTSLIIDPSPIVRKVASHLMLTEGMLAISVSTGAEGFEIVRAQGPQIILVDSRIPDMDPLDFIRSVRSLNQAVHPVMLLTTIENDPVIASQAIGAGAQQILVKPYDRFTLREALMLEQATAA